MRRRVLGALLRNDVRLLFRDPLLVVLFVIALVLGLASRAALPAIDEGLRASGVMPSEPGGMIFRETFPLWVAFIGYWQAALMPGVVFAFLLLGEKEDRTLTAMRVMPVPFRRYLLYRVGLPFVVALVFALVVPLLIGFAPIRWWQHVPLALGAATTAPLATLLCARFANDKVQGLAFTKLSGVAGLTIIVGFFLDEPWQWGMGLFPPFLIAKSYWMALDGHALFVLPAVVGASVQIALLAMLLPRFEPATS